MFERSDRFQQSFVLAHAERLRLEFMELFDPFLDIYLLRSSNRDKKLQDHLTDLFKDAIRLRAMCIPLSGVRYEMIHYTPDDIYQPDMMNALNSDMQVIRPDDSSSCHINICIHGLIVAHKTQETSSSGVEQIKDLTTSFIQKSDYNDRIAKDRGLELVSDKATVMIY